MSTAIPSAALDFDEPAALPPPSERTIVLPAPGRLPAPQARPRTEWDIEYMLDVAASDIDSTDLDSAHIDAIRALLGDLEQCLELARRVGTDALDTLRVERISLARTEQAFAGVYAELGEVREQLATIAADRDRAIEAQARERESHSTTTVLLCSALAETLRLSAAHAKLSAENRALLLSNAELSAARCDDTVVAEVAA